MSPALLRLVTDDTPREASQLLLRPVIAFVEADIVAPFRVRLACRRRPVRKADLAQSHPEPLELFARPRRPILFGECERTPGPCPWIGCRHHLAVDIRSSGRLRENFPDLEIDELAETCSLKVAARGEMTTEQIGALMGVTPERITQIYTAAEPKYKAAIEKLRVYRDLVEGEWR